MQQDVHGGNAMKKGAGAITLVQVAMQLRIGMEKIAHGTLHLVIVNKMAAGNILIKALVLILFLQED
jgi:hypothetical protein